jgi:hypothetical protein
MNELSLLQKEFMEIQTIKIDSIIINEKTSIEIVNRLKNKKMIKII